MTRKEAQKILGITNQADGRTIKSSFRKLMSQYHPDAVGTENPEILRRAQLINEAYSILRETSEAGQEVFTERRAAWKGKTIENAFTERTVYLAFSPWEGAEIMYEEAARGKYLWDPELEDFDCLLKSVNQAAIELLEEAERQSGRRLGDKSGWREERFPYHVELFHLLAGQFIRPVYCLEKLAVSRVPRGQRETADSAVGGRPRACRSGDMNGEGAQRVCSVVWQNPGVRIYKFRGFLGAKRGDGIWKAVTGIKKGDILKVASLENNRIAVSDGLGSPSGYLSLAEDQWYYIVIPILQRRLAQVKILAGEIEVMKNCRPHRVRLPVDLYLRLEKTGESEAGADNEAETGRNLRIQRILDEYRTYIRQNQGSGI